MNLAQQLQKISKSLTVLYAEDEVTLREGMSSSLARLFEKTLIAKDGKEAWELFQTNHVDVVLTDINMPNLNGIELIKEIRHSRKKIPPIIVLTAYNDNDYLLELVNLHVEGFLMKPTDKDRLVEILLKICTGIQNQKLLKQSERELQASNKKLEEQNRVLNTKLQQIAMEKNRSKQKEKSSEKSKALEEASDNYFQTLLLEDKEELEELSAEIDSYINLLFRSDRIEDSYITKLSNAFERYAVTINVYVIFLDISTQLAVLAKDILNHVEAIKRSQQDAALLLESLHYSLENFRVNVWLKEAKNPTFFNESLISDIQVISNFLNGVENDGEVIFF